MDPIQPQHFWLNVPGTRRGATCSLPGWNDVNRIADNARWLLLALLCLPPVSHACRCPDGVPASTAYRQAQVVVLATVVQVSGDRDREGATAVVTVSRAWKAPVDERIEIFTNTTCAFDFQPGQTYLLYVQKTAAGARYWTKRCFGNLPAADAARHIRWLDRHGSLTRGDTPR